MMDTSGLGNGRGHRVEPLRPTHLINLIKVGEMQQHQDVEVEVEVEVAHRVDSAGEERSYGTLEDSEITSHRRQRHQQWTSTLSFHVVQQKEKRDVALPPCNRYNDTASIHLEMDGGTRSFMETGRSCTMRPRTSHLLSSLHSPLRLFRPPSLPPSCATSLEWRCTRRVNRASRTEPHATRGKIQLGGEGTNNVLAKLNTHSTRVSAGPCWFVVTGSWSRREVADEKNQKFKVFFYLFIFFFKENNTWVHHGTSAYRFVSVQLTTSIPLPQRVFGPPPPSVIIKEAENKRKIIIIIGGGAGAPQRILNDARDYNDYFTINIYIYIFIYIYIYKCMFIQAEGENRRGGPGVEDRMVRVTLEVSRTCLTEQNHHHHHHKIGHVGIGTHPFLLSRHSNLLFCLFFICIRTYSLSSPSLYIRWRGETNNNNNNNNNIKKVTNERKKNGAREGAKRSFPLFCGDGSSSIDPTSSRPLHSARGPSFPEIRVEEISSQFVFPCLFYKPPPIHLVVQCCDVLCEHHLCCTCPSLSFFLLFEEEELTLACVKFSFIALTSCYEGCSACTLTLIIFLARSPPTPPHTPHHI
eukprot:gene4630-3334_t